MGTATTLRNLMKVIGAGGLPLSTFTVYVYYLFRAEEPTTYRQIKKDLLLSAASVNRHNRHLSAVGVLEVDSSPGRPTIYSPKEFTNKQLDTLLKSSTYAHRPSSYLYNSDIKRDIYNRMYKYRRQEEKKNSVPAKDLIGSTPSLKTIYYALPSDQRGFRVSPNSMRRLEELASKVDIAKYIQWFVKVKLIRLIPRFNMGIFLYSGMVDEYKTVARRSEKVEKYKTVTKRLKGSFDERAKKFKEEMK